MTTYTQTLMSHPDRKRKKEVRDFLFSFFKDMHLNKVVGLAGPNITDYLNFMKSQGFNEFEIYEIDALTAIHQLSVINDKITLKLGNIINANPDEPNTLYDLDYCVTGRYMKDHMARFKSNFIMTFSGRVSLKETLDNFFEARQESIINTIVRKLPLLHTEYITNLGRYIQLTYRDTSPMFCIAKIA